MWILYLFSLFFMYVPIFIYFKIKYKYIFALLKLFAKK